MPASVPGGGDKGFNAAMRGRKKDMLVSLTSLLIDHVTHFAAARSFDAFDGLHFHCIGASKTRTQSSTDRIRVSTGPPAPDDARVRRRPSRRTIYVAGSPEPTRRVVCRPVPTRFRRPSGRSTAATCRERASAAATHARMDRASAHPRPRRPRRGRDERRRTVVQHREAAPVPFAHSTRLAVLGDHPTRTFSWEQTAPSPDTATPRNPPDATVGVARAHRNARSTRIRTSSSSDSQIDRT